MKRDEYIRRRHISAFVNWLANRLDTPESFTHSYRMRKTGTYWRCDCLYSAFQRYEWQFSTYDPCSRQSLSGKTFAESADALTLIGLRLKEAIVQDDCDLALSCCKAVLKWGGIRSGHYLEGLGDNLVSTLRRSTTALADPGLDLSRLPLVDMNAGWTKIYSLLLDDFIMYDSRVAAALCMLVGLFAQDIGLLSLPGELRFCQLAHRATVDRSPPYLREQFPMARYGNDQHLRSNIMANWILTEALRVRPSRFTLLRPSNRSLWALQSALFMIGYETLPNKTLAPNRPKAKLSSGEGKTNLSPLSGRGEPIQVTYQDGIRQIRWGSVQFHLPDVLVNEILHDFFRDPTAWYPLGTSMTNPPTSGLGAFVRSRVRSLTSRHATAIAAVMVHEGLLEWRGAKPIELRKKAVRGAAG